MGEYKQKMSKQRHSFLLTFFDNTTIYEEKQVNGFWLVKHLNGNTNTLEVNIYTPDSFKVYKTFIEPKIGTRNSRTNKATPSPEPKKPILAGNRPNNKKRGRQTR